MILFRNSDPRAPFLWEDTDQPAARWHGAGEGPAHYLALTPDGAWAEFLRHEEIRDPVDLEGVERALWAIEVPATDTPDVELPMRTLLGGTASYNRCRVEARRLRAGGARALRAPCAALIPGTSSGWQVDGGLIPAAPRNEEILVYFGPPKGFVGWAAAHIGRPQASLLARVNYL